MSRMLLVALALLVVCARPVAAEEKEMREGQLKADPTRGIAENPALLIQTGHLEGISYSISART